MIHLAEPNSAVDKEMLDEVVETLKSGRYILGEKTAKFEKDFASFIGTEHAVAVSSGTAALETALLACGIGKGDEVITTPHSFVATANSIILTGATPVFVDIESGTFNIDVSKIEEKITNKTKAILPVHIYGQPADMDKIMKLARDNNLKVIEDACQAHGAEYKNKKVGSIGDVGCFSFFPSKVMTVCGDGGMITTNNKEVRDFSIMYRNQGRRPPEKYVHEIIGFNYRMSELAAAIGNYELKRLEDWIEKRRMCANYYSELLNDTEEIILPTERKWARAVYYVYTVRIREREKLQDWLRKNNIESGIYYPVPIHLQPPYKKFGYEKGDFPVTEKIADEILSLPMHQNLKKEAIKIVVEKIKEFFRRQ